MKIFRDKYINVENTVFIDLSPDINQTKNESKSIEFIEIECRKDRDNHCGGENDTFNPDCNNVNTLKSLNIPHDEVDK
jgi:hypothetical protein